MCSEACGHHFHSRELISSYPKPISFTNLQAESKHNLVSGRRCEKLIHSEQRNSKGASVRKDSVAACRRLRKHVAGARHEHVIRVTSNFGKSSNLKVSVWPSIERLLSYSSFATGKVLSVYSIQVFTSAIGVFSGSYLYLPVARWSIAALVPWFIWLPKSQRIQFATMKANFQASLSEVSLGVLLKAVCSFQTSAERYTDRETLSSLRMATPC